MELINEGNSVSPTWFGLAIQALMFLAVSDQVCPSASIACNTNSGVTFMRRVMAPLVRANIVQAREGRDGGYLLAKSVESITLADVYSALQVTNTLAVGLLESTREGCPNGQALYGVFSEIVDKAEKSVLDVLKQYTLADLLKRVN